MASVAHRTSEGEVNQEKVLLVGCGVGAGLFWTAHEVETLWE